MTALNADEATLFYIELFFAIVRPFVKAAGAERFAAGVLFAAEPAEFSQIGGWCRVSHGLTLHKS